GGGKSPSTPALDAAFDASIRLLKRQRPRLRELAGSVGKIFRGGKPMVMGLRRAMRRAAAPVQPASRAVRRLVGLHGKKIWSWMKRTLTSRGSTLSMASAFIIAVAVLTFSAFRMTAGAAHSQSRCPTDLASYGRRPFGVLVDSIGNGPQGSDVSLHFDVCGLTEGTPFKVRMSLNRD